MDKATAPKANSNYHIFSCHFSIQALTSNFPNIIHYSKYIHHRQPCGRAESMTFNLLKGFFKSGIPDCPELEREKIPDSFRYQNKGTQTGTGLRWHMPEYRCRQVLASMAMDAQLCIWASSLCICYSDSIRLRLRKRIVKKNRLFCRFLSLLNYPLPSSNKALMALCLAPLSYSFLCLCCIFSLWLARGLSQFLTSARGKLVFLFYASSLYWTFWYVVQVSEMMDKCGTLQISYREGEGASDLYFSSLWWHLSALGGVYPYKNKWDWFSNC